MQNIIRAIETHYKERAKLAKVTLQPRVCVSRSVCKRVQRGTIHNIESRSGMAKSTGSISRND
jgi:hypothetical protein